MKTIVAFISFLAFIGCETSGKKSGKSDLSKKSGKSSSGAEEEPAEAREPEASANLVTFINSQSNSPLSSYTVSTSKAEDIVQKFADAKSRVGLESKIAAERLAQRSLGEVLSSSKKLAAVEMEKSAGNTVSDSVKLELALAAVNNKNYAFAEYFLQILTDSKNPKIKAAAYNAIGVIALKDDRVPEAVLYFKQALSINSSYRPAMLNLGFIALKGGDFESARRLLGEMQNDWFVQYGLITLSRLEGNETRAEDLCEKVIKKSPQHKPALFNCALFELQNKRNFSKARSYAEKAAVAKYGDSEWDERAMQLSNLIDFEEAALKREKAPKKAPEKANNSPNPESQNGPRTGDQPVSTDGAGAPEPM